MEAMVRRNPRYTVDAKPTSLCDLGYCDIGLDDNWQACGSYGKEGYTYHDEDGNPVVNLDRFPSLKNMTGKAHSLGLTSGFYGNNCICNDQKTSNKKFYVGDVKALREFGFDSWKLDGCGAQTDMQLWNDLIKASEPTTGRKEIMVENCHWGSKVPFKPNATWCPWNFYRTSGDVRANYPSVVGNLQTTVTYAKQNLSYPGCWAYPDMVRTLAPLHPLVGPRASPSRRSHGRRSPVLLVLCCLRSSRWACSHLHSAATRGSLSPRLARTLAVGRSSRRHLHSHTTQTIRRSWMPSGPSSRIAKCSR